MESSGFVGPGHRDPELQAPGHVLVQKNVVVPVGADYSIESRELVTARAPWGHYTFEALYLEVEAALPGGITLSLEGGYAQVDLGANSAFPTRKVVRKLTIPTTNPILSTNPGTVGDPLALNLLSDGGPIPSEITVVEARATYLVI